MSCADKNIAENLENWRDAPYYSLAEEDMGWQWEQIIRPLISDFDFEVTLELAPGHGRNTSKLLKLCREIHLVDLVPQCIEACRHRFGDSQEGVALYYYINDGRSLPCTLTERVSCVYCFDAMVHFELDVIRAYLKHIHRVLRDGGRAFLHHSDLKGDATGSLGDWTENLYWRTAVSKDEVADGAREVGLEVPHWHRHLHSLGKK